MGAWSPGVLEYWTAHRLPFVVSHLPSAFAYRPSAVSPLAVLLNCSFAPLTLVPPRNGSDACVLPGLPLDRRAEPRYPMPRLEWWVVGLGSKSSEIAFSASKPHHPALRHGARKQSSYHLHLHRVPFPMLSAVRTGRAHAPKKYDIRSTIGQHLLFGSLHCY